MGTVLSRLRALARAIPNLSAIDRIEHSIPYASLLSHVLAGRAWLRSRGVDARAVVGVTIAEETEHLVASLSLLAAGAGQVTLATHDTPVLRQRIADRADVTHWLTDGGPAQGPAGVPAVRWPGVEALPGAASDGQGDDMGGGRLILRTSGTTGDINLVALDEESLLVQADQHTHYSQERSLRLASVEHNNSKRHRLFALLAGGTCVLRPHGTFDVVEYCRQRGVTSMDVTRLHVADLLAVCANREMGGVKVVAAGGPLPFDLRQQMTERVTGELYVRYGATECGTISMAVPGQHDADESAGMPLPGVRVEVVDADHRTLPIGEMGRLRIRTPGMARGYLNSPADAAGRFHEGWFYPGDVGYVRGDGQLVVRGRQDEMMILNGLNIFPADIEQVLERHPAVAQAAAVAMDSRVHGQIPVAAVELRAGAAATAMQLQQYARQVLALRSPRRIVIVPALPRNSQDKLVRAEVRRLFQPAEAGV